MALQPVANRLRRPAKAKVMGDGDPLPRMCACARCSIPELPGREPLRFSQVPRPGGLVIVARAPQGLDIQSLLACPLRFMHRSVEKRGESFAEL